MKIDRSLDNPNTYGITFDEDEKNITNKQVDDALVAVGAIERPVQNALEHSNPIEQPFEEQVEPLTPPALYDGQGETEQIDNSNCDGDMLVPPVMNFDEPKEKKQENATDNNVDDNPEDALTVPEMNFDKK